MATVIFVAGMASYFFDIGFWPAVAIVAFGLIVNGVVAEIEDRAPSGLQNPKDYE